MDYSKIPVVILAGGLGTRIREETEFKPKPMVEIGGLPIIWHIMRNFSSQGFNNFIICAGYKANAIKDYFYNYELHTSDVSIKLGPNKETIFLSDQTEVDWNINIIDTGLGTQTGGRLAKIAKYIDHSRFICTYGDGVANVDIPDLLDFHDRSNTVGTVTVVNPISRFGVVEISNDNKVLRFREKPTVDSYISAGFFVFEKSFLELLNSDSILEKEPLAEISKRGQLSSYKHKGFWQPMDTFREMQMLNELWDNGEAPWKNWN
jgi:glucose-1-phosphate cytidylyltransferase